MDDGSRKLRGLLGVGTTWGVAWAGIGAAVGWAVAALGGGSLAISDWALGMGAYGFVSGLGFGTLLATLEDRGSVAALSTARATAIGVVGAVAVPILFGLMGFFEPGTTPLDVIGAMALTGALGGTFAGGSVAIARRAAALEGEAADVLLPSAPLVLGPERVREEDVAVPGSVRASAGPRSAGS